jgi:hypothetical protein
MCQAAQAVADAVLFEGYILYPYRPSAIKNRQRWNFGTLYPGAYAEAHVPRERSQFSAEILFTARPETALSARARFLQFAPARSVREDQWREAFPRSCTADRITLFLLQHGFEQVFDFSPAAEVDVQTRGLAGVTPQGRLKLLAEPLHDNAYRLHATFENVTPMRSADIAAPKDVQETSFQSAHLLLQIEHGSFISLLEPDTPFAHDVRGCVQDGVFPVLVGAPGDFNCVLCSPIILYDYPQIAPESSGNFFDGTEMDEMLALRVLTLTDKEKEEMRSSDGYARDILERTETLPRELFEKLHGAVRGLRSVVAPESAAVDEAGLAAEPFDPFAERPLVGSVRVFGIEIRVGDRVRIWPRNRADILDMAMEGKIAVIEAIEQDLENNVQFAVVLEDDPGRDLGMLRQPGHRFFFTPAEVEPLALGAI